MKKGEGALRVSKQKSGNGLVNIRSRFAPRSSTTHISHQEAELPEHLARRPLDIGAREGTLVLCEDSRHAEPSLQTHLSF